MFLKNKISVSTDNYSAKINKLRECIEAADSVVIGAARVFDFGRVCIPRRKI